MPHTTQLQRWQIVSHMSEGSTATSVAEVVGVSRGTVARHWRRYNAEHTVADRQRKRKRSTLGEAPERLIEREMVGAVGMSTRRMAKKLCVEQGVKVSHVAVSKLLHAKGYTPRTRKQEYQLTMKQKLKRLAWCKRFNSKPVDWWRKVLFVDEKNFGVTWRGNRKNDIVWGDDHTPIPPRNLQTFQSAIKVGVALCYEGKTRAYELPPWNGPAYNTMLRELVIPFKQRHFHGEEIVLFQDNDPAHLTASNKPASGAVSVRG
jgi:transposase